jgi:hypothetical protein
MTPKPFIYFCQIVKRIPHLRNKTLVLRLRSTPITRQSGMTDFLWALFARRRLTCAVGRPAHRSYQFKCFIKADRSFPAFEI